MSFASLGEVTQDEEHLTNSDVRVESSDRVVTLAGVVNTSQATARAGTTHVCAASTTLPVALTQYGVVSRFFVAIAILPRQRPVSECGACTGFDSGDHRCRRYTASHTIEAIARNSLCQF
jgi:hypothetical protein